ncbi:MAG: DUF3857 domain-containing protein [Flavobacteriaceae bacterium]|nr:DUF3857 domain-containing protein [Flavobacteriaceae bacterium]
MIKNSILVVVFLITTNSFAQFYKTYDWKETPEIHQLSKEEQKEPSVGILKKHVVEYAKSMFGDLLKVYETDHTITRVNNDKGIAKHNTVYIPMYEVINVLDIKARTINAEGKVTVLNKDNIKEVKNVDEYGDFKIFAIEGVEKNSEIEVLYTVEKEYDMHGQQNIQGEYPIREAQFLFITGDANAQIKAYRTESKFESVTINNTIGKLLTIKNIPAMVEEEYSTPDANKIAVAYQCFPKEQNITQEMFWSNVVNNVGPQFFPEEPITVVTDDLPNVTSGKTNLSVFEKANLLDDYIKTNFTIVKNNNAELSDVNYILKNKSASTFGILKAYAQYLKALDIKYEIVITANRYLKKFDPDFFNPNQLQEFLIYLPTEEKYIATDRLEYRVGEAPFNILGNYGLYITDSLEYYFSKIVQTDPNFSSINRVMDITFDEELQSATLKQSQEYTGHWSATSRAILNFYPEQSIKEYEDYLTGSGIEDKVVESYEALNTELLQLEYNKPFKTSSTITSESLLEEVGDSYLFQIGKVIGTQSELYQETKRVNPIEMQYPNQYDYTITIHIPKGYTAEGLEELNIDKSYKSVKGNKLCKFESSYKVEGNKVIITIQEFYKSNEYDLNRYEEFREVINAASDFNKTAILLKAIE